MARKTIAILAVAIVSVICLAVWAAEPATDPPKTEAAPTPNLTDAQQAGAKDEKKPAQPTASTTLKYEIVAGGSGNSWP